jgi:hypothetical protein
MIRGGRKTSRYACIEERFLHCARRPVRRKRTGVKKAGGLRSE